MTSQKIVSISSEKELELLRENKTGSFRLENDIDLNNAQWVPVDFDGVFDGNNKTISRLRIEQTTPQNLQGFFGKLSEKAIVKNLSLKEVNISVADNAEYAGVFAGINYGTISGCTAGADAPFSPIPSGKRNTLVGFPDDSSIMTDAENACIGAIAGYNAGTVTKTNSYVTMFSSVCTLCGKNEGNADGLCLDTSNRSSRLSQKALKMRRDIVSHMESMGNFRWIPSKEMVFTSAYSSTVKHYEKGRVHFGLPYTQKYGSLERAGWCLDKDGYVKDLFPVFSDASREAKGCEEIPWDVYLGNDCSGAVYWSWMRACPSVSFGFTGDMVPTPENIRDYGVIPLGSYTADSLLTDEIIKKNTPERIAECLALLQIGDAIVQRTPEHGHTRLVARDAFVLRDENGRINCDASYIATHEQGVGKGSSGRNSTWQLNARYTFTELLKDYLPITNRELIAGAPAEVLVKTAYLKGPFEGLIRSNYRIISSTMQLTDKKTGNKYENTVFTAIDKDRNKEKPNDDFARSTVREISLSDHKDGFKNIPEGRYDYSVSVLLSNGASISVCRGVYKTK